MGCPLLGVEHQLKEDEVAPLTELGPDLAETANLLEAEPFVEPDRTGIGRIDARDHHVDLEIAGSFDERRQELGADPVPTLVGADVDRVLDRMAIALPGPPRPEGRVTEDGDSPSLLTPSMATRTGNLVA